MPGRSGSWGWWSHNFRSVVGINHIHRDYTESQGKAQEKFRQYKEFPIETLWIWAHKNRRAQKFYVARLVCYVCMQFFTNCVC